MPTRRTIIITGATSGIGQRVAIALAKQGEHLVLTARSEAKAAATRALIAVAAPRAQVDVHYVDFTRLVAVAVLATEIASRYERIDVLQQRGSACVLAAHRA
jgi:short-subunit dehydrogenase